MEPLNVFEYEVLARERMDPVYWDFYAGGSDEEVTLRANQADFARIHLRPRMLVDVTRCDTSTSVLGLPVPMPILVAPTSMHCLAHPEGECATAQGAGAAGTLMIASTDATRPLEEIAQAASGAHGVQQILEILHIELERAMKLAGCPTIASINRSLVQLT